MSDKLDALFQKFVSEARQILIEEAMASFTALAQGGGGEIPTPFRNKPGPKPKSAPTKAAPKAKWAKRTPEELEALTKSLVAHVRKNPGQRSEQIAEALKTTTKDLSLPLKALVEAKQFKTSGVRRGMTYSVK